MLKYLVSRHWVIWLFVSVVVGLAVPGLVGGASALGRIQDVRFDWFVLVISVVFLAANLKVLRVRMMLRALSHDIGHFPGLRLFFATAFAANATPGSFAAPITAIAVLRRHGVAGATTMASLLTVSVFDALVTLALLAATLIWWSADLAALPVSFRVTAVVGAFTLIGSLVFLGIRYFRQLTSLSLSALRASGVSRETRFHVTRQLFRFRRGLERISRLDRRELFLFAVLGVIHQLLWYSVLFVSLQALGAMLSWPLAFVIQLAAAGGARLLLLPGGAGGAEVAAFSILSPFIAPPTAAAAILLWRLAGYYFFLMAGFLAFLHELGVPAFRRQSTGEES